MNERTRDGHSKSYSGRQGVQTSSDRPLSFGFRSSFLVRTTRRIAIGLALLSAQLSFHASAQSVDALRERYRGQCRAEVIAERGRRPDNRPLVRACVIARMQRAMPRMAHAAVSAPIKSATPMALLEGTPWLAQPSKGPAAAKGIIYFVGGYSLGGRSRDDFRLSPYLLKSLSDDGWDIILAKLPHNVDGPGFQFVGGGARTIERRAAELRAQGYKRVIVGGHSWGAWAAMMAARDGLAVDALLLSAPNAFGERISPITGGPNPDFQLSMTEFEPLIGKITVPTVLILPADKVWDPDPAARGRIAEKHFAAANIAHLVVANAPGFSGHYAGWLPFFDFAYGKCIATFLQKLASAPCLMPLLSNNDFRSILWLRQVANAETKRLTAADKLVGKKYAVYTLGDVDNKRIEYLSPTKRMVMESSSQDTETVAFKDGLECAKNACSVLIMWSERNVLEFDAKTGALRAWWIEEN